MTRKYKDINEVRLLDHVKVVGDAGEYQVLAIDVYNDRVALTVPRNNWHNLDKIHFVCIKDNYIQSETIR